MTCPERALSRALLSASEAITRAQDSYNRYRDPERKREAFSRVRKARGDYARICSLLGQRFAA